MNGIECRQSFADSMAYWFPLNRRSLILLSAIELLFVWISAANVGRGTYEYDEADYMYAASKGYIANYTDSPTMPFMEFLRLGLAARNPEQRAHVADTVRQDDDVLYYRHWHGPTYYLALIPVAGLGLDEAATRRSMLFIPALTIAFVYIGVAWLVPGEEGETAAFLASILFAFSSTMFRSSELAPHKLFALFCLTSLFALSKALVTGQARYLCVAVALACFACSTLEGAFVLLFPIVLCGVWERKRLGLDRTSAFRLSALALCALVVAWPGSVLRLSLPKSYFFMAYLFFLRRGHDAFEEITLTETWANRILTSPVEWLVIVAAISIYILSRDARTRLRPFLPLLVYGFAAIFIIVRITTVRLRYSFVFQPALDVFAAIAIASSLSRLRAVTRNSVTVVVAVALVAGMLYQVHLGPPASDRRSYELVTYLRQKQWGGRLLLVNWSDVPVIHYYFPRFRLRSYRGADPTPSEISGSGAEIVLLTGYPIRSIKIGSSD